MDSMKGTVTLVLSDASRPSFSRPSWTLMRKLFVSWKGTSGRLGSLVQDVWKDDGCMDARTILIAPGLRVSVMKGVE